MLNREQKTKIVDYMEKICEKSSISKKTLGNTIRSYHVSLPFVLLIFIFYASEVYVTLIGLSLIGVYTLFFLTNGCLLTMLEHRLVGDEFTIADPFIEFFGLESSSANRVRISYWIATSYLTFFAFIYYYRFYYKKTTIEIK